MENKKLKKSKITLGLYICAGAILVYALYAIFNSISYLNNYFGTYGSSIGQNFGDAISYILNQSLSYIVFAALVFASATILTEVRKLNPDNYMSEDELKAIELAKAEKVRAKAEAKAEKEAAKGKSENPDDQTTNAGDAEFEVVTADSQPTEAVEATHMDGVAAAEASPEEAKEAIAKKAAEVREAAKEVVEN